MAKQLTNIHIKTWYLTGNLRYNRDFHGDFLPEPIYDISTSFHHPILTLDEVLRPIYTAIQNKNSSELKSLLKSNFIYPDIISTSTSTTNRIFQPNLYHEFEEHYQGPLIEGLMFDYPARLAHLITTLIASGDEALQETFVVTLKELSLGSAFTLTQQHEDEIKQLLDSMGKYAAGLDKANIAKGKLALNVVATLRKDLSNHCTQRWAKLNERPTLTDLNTLKFKLLFADTLHCEDRFLKMHRGWKHCVTNLLTILFTFGVANLINKVSTGQWMFFNKTTTEEKVAAVDHALRKGWQMR